MSKLQTAQDTESQGNRATGDLGDNRYKAVSEGKTTPFRYKMMGSEVVVLTQERELGLQDPSHKNISFGHSSS